MTIEHYYYGLAALMYLTTCWMFAAVRWFHTCKQPKSTHRYIWPDRKLQCLLYSCASVLLLCGSNGEKVFDEPVEEPEIPQAKGYDDWFN